MKTMKTLGIRCSDSVISSIENLADRKGVPPSTIARELLEQALNRQDLGQAIAVLNQQMEQIIRDNRVILETQENHEQLIRRVGRAAARGIWTTEEFARILIADPRKYESMLQAVQQAKKEEKNGSKKEDMS